MREHAGATVCSDSPPSSRLNPPAPRHSPPAPRHAPQPPAPSTAFLAAALANSSDLIVVVDGDGRIRYANQASRRMLGTAPEELVGTLARAHLHPDELAEVRAAVAGGLLVGLSPSPPSPARLRHADGSWRDVEVVATDLREDPDVGGVLLSVRDVSERRRAEGRAAVHQERFEQAFLRSPLGMTITDLEGNYSRVNPALCALLGRSEADLLATDVLTLTHPEDLATTVDGAKDLLLGERAHLSLEKRFLRPDGTSVWVRSHSVLLHGPDGAPTHFLTQMEDIAERRALHERLRWNAHHDSLTGLLDRAGLEDQLEALADRSPGTPVGVLFIDLDHFKLVNDRLDHARGDQVLRAVADRLAGSVRGEDLTARIGGDEFVVVCPEVDDARRLAALAERALRRIRRPILLEDGALRISASIGCAVGTVGDADRVLREADAASYGAKRQGRNGVVAAGEPLAR